MMESGEYKAKHAELMKVAESIVLWQQASQTKEQKAKVKSLHEELQAETYAHECAFLETKLRIFRQIEAILKSA